MVVTRRVVDQPLVDLELDFGQLCLVDLGEVGEVEAEPARLDQGAGLMGMIPQHLAQTPMEDVGAGVALSDRFAARGIDHSRGLLPHCDEARAHPESVPVKSLQGVSGVADDSAAGLES